MTPEDDLFRELKYQSSELNKWEERQIKTSQEDLIEKIKMISNRSEGNLSHLLAFFSCEVLAFCKL